MSEKDREAFEALHSLVSGRMNQDPRWREECWKIWQAALSHERSSPRVRAMEKVVMESRYLLEAAEDYVEENHPEDAIYRPYQATKEALAELDKVEKP